MADFKTVTADFAVAEQLSPADFARAAQAGFTTVIANRPDGESPDQLTLAQAKAAAEAAGLRFVAAPFAGGPPSEAIVTKTQAVLGETAGPILAYCRSGTRSVTAWAYAQVKSGAATPEAAIEAARRAGYDISAQAGTLRGLAKG
ncbi:MAG: TIGR01244 family phosphatase [Alphaproteobacteria bacterium]|nr:TIGR01244 family phosphatase [Alphaproteobacteria bacterium]